MKPLTEMILELMQDGAHHTPSELTRALVGRIAPEKCIRSARRSRESARNCKKVKTSRIGPQPQKCKDEISRGTAYKVQCTLHYLLRQGKILRVAKATYKRQLR